MRGHKRLGLLLFCSGIFLTGCAMHITTSRLNALLNEHILNKSGEEVLVGAGDIARCRLSAASDTATLLDIIPGTVFTTGDNAYDNGTEREFRECYEPTWGRHKARTRPTPGNHEYKTEDAAPYYRYFGKSAGPPGLGYYSYELGEWRIIALNSNIAANKESEQMRWLQAELANNPSRCTLAYWHHPMFSSGKKHGSDLRMQEIFAALYAAGVDVVVTGHDHLYERLAPMNARGQRDPLGIRSFIAGTGGAILYGLGKIHPLSESRLVAHGVLKFTLKEAGYDWQFISVYGRLPSDSGSDKCH